MRLIEHPILGGGLQLSASASIQQYDIVGLAFSGSLIANDNSAALSISEFIFKFPMDSALFCIPLDPPDEK